jgi:hypothetical protein
MTLRATSIGMIPFLLLFGMRSVAGQSNGGGKQAVQQRVSELRRSIAANRAQLQKYQWIETTQVSIKGENKKNEQMACHFGSDGKVQKTPIGPPPAAPKELPGGLRGKVAKKKIAEMKDYMDRFKSLISHYAPPDPQRLQTALQAGRASLNLSSGGPATLTFADYYKQGDKVAFTFETSAKKLLAYDVDTYLDGPKDIVTLANQFTTLPDGTNYLQKTTLESKSKEIQIQTISSDYNPVSP